MGMCGIDLALEQILQTNGKPVSNIRLRCLSTEGLLSSSQALALLD
jgi:hypothetical protein